MLAQLACENLSAAFKLRRLRGVIGQSGWRVPALSLLAAGFARVFTAARFLIATATDRAPPIADLPPDALAAVQGRIALTVAALAVLTAWVLRDLATRICARAAPRAAALKPGLWDGAVAAEAAAPARREMRASTWISQGIVMAISLALAFLILLGQFLDSVWWRWLFRPVLTLPWAGSSRIRRHRLQGTDLPSGTVGRLRAHKPATCPQNPLIRAQVVAKRSNAPEVSTVPLRSCPSAIRVTVTVSPSMIAVTVSALAGQGVDAVTTLRDGSRVLDGHEDLVSDLDRALVIGAGKGAAVFGVVIFPAGGAHRKAKPPCRLRSGDDHAGLFACRKGQKLALGKTPVQGGLGEGAKRKAGSTGAWEPFWAKEFAFGDASRHGINMAPLNAPHQEFPIVACHA